MIRTILTAFAVVLLAFAAVGAQKVRLRSKITPDCGSSSSLKFADIYGDGNLAVMGSYNCRGAFIFDISNPDAPTQSNWYNPIRSGTAATREQFLEAIVIGNRGYFGSGNGGGVYIVDLTNPSSPRLLGIVNSASGGGFNSIHEMVVFQQNGATYLIENFNGFSNKLLKVINVSDPALPVFVRDINPTETTWVHAMHIRGSRMFTSGWGSSSARGRTEIYDISNLGTQAPALLGFVEDASGTTNGNGMHSGWTSEDGRYLYSAREIGGSAANGSNPGDVRVYDVQNPATPLLVNRVTMSDLGLNAVTPHNPVVKGNKLYVSWYQAGLQLFDITNPSSLTRVGQYDTYQSAFADTSLPKSLAASGEAWDLICGGVNFQNSVPTDFEGLWAVYPFLGEDKVLLADLAEGLLIVDVTKANATPTNVVSDFDGDKKTDLASFTPDNGVWTVEQSSDSRITGIPWGARTDILVPADYDGDGKTDQAIFRPATGQWWIYGSVWGVRGVEWGTGGDVPVPADYDADGKTDVAVWRPSTGMWYLLQSTLGFKAFWWGTTNDKPLTGDYDGDGKADITVYRPSDGVWYVLPSSSSIPMFVNWGSSSDLPLYGDFIGDDRSDFAVYRPSTGIWYVLDADLLNYKIVNWGLAGDVPVPADYDGDAKADFAIFRPSDNGWWKLSSIDGAVAGRRFGGPGDVLTTGTINPR